MTPHEFHIICKAMEQFGGSFVKSYAKTLRAADPVHREKLLKALPGIVKHYTTVAQSMEAEVSKS